uniref:PATROL1-like C-terminal domain-containing protein n=1 Tax=Oryza glaberrima TaxID=4538 RepID=I1P558_ORYGL
VITLYFLLSLLLLSLSLSLCRPPAGGEGRRPAGSSASSGQRVLFGGLVSVEDEHERQENGSSFCHTIVTAMEHASSSLWCSSSSSAATARLLAPCSHFDRARAAAQSAVGHVAEVAAYRLIFLDSHHSFYDGLYVGGVADARIRLALRTLKQNLSLLLSMLVDRAQPVAVREVMKASFQPAKLNDYLKPYAWKFQGEENLDDIYSDALKKIPDLALHSSGAQGLILANTSDCLLPTNANVIQGEECMYSQQNTDNYGIKYRNQLPFLLNQVAETHLVDQIIERHTYSLQYTKLIATVAWQVLTELSINPQFLSSGPRLVHASEEVHEVILVVEWNTFSAVLSRFSMAGLLEFNPGRDNHMLVMTGIYAWLIMLCKAWLSDAPTQIGMVAVLEHQVLQEELQTSFDPGGFLHRLGDKPNFKKKGLSGSRLGYTWAARQPVAKKPKQAQAETIQGQQQLKGEEGK